MTTRICIRLNDQEQAAFAKIKGRLNDAEGFRVMLKAADNIRINYPSVFKDFFRNIPASIKTSARNGRHIGKKKPANY